MQTTTYHFLRVSVHTQFLIDFYRARHFRTVQRPAELEAKSKKDIHSRQESHRKYENLSQESNASKFNDQLMFGCPLDRDDDDDVLSITFDQSHHDDIANILNGCSSDTENKCFNLDDSLTSSLMSSDDIDVFNVETLNSSDFSGYGEEQAILTPAYFDPGTGTVTLLLPALNPEY